MNAYPLHLHSRLLTIGIALLLAVFLVCSNHSKAEESNHIEPSHGGHTNTDHEKLPHNNHGGHDLGHIESMLMVRSEPADIKPGQPVKLILMIHDASGAMIKDFEIIHEKRLHLIIVRDGLELFAHIHPDIDQAGDITDTFTFPTAGNYHLYLDYKLTGKEAATAIAEMNIAGTPPPKPNLVPNAPGRVMGDTLSADIAIENAKSGETTRILFTLFDAAGKQVSDLKPYLGAMGHLVVISADGKQYVHSHPVEDKSSGRAVVFEAHFPRSGIYKGWGQFLRSDTVRNVPFVVKIE